MSLSKFITKGSQFLLFDNSSRIVFVCESLFVGVTNLEYAKENLKNDVMCLANTFITDVCFMGTRDVGSVKGQAAITGT